MSHFVIPITFRNNFLSHFVIPVIHCNNILSHLFIITGWTWTQDPVSETLETGPRTQDSETGSTIQGPESRILGSKNQDQESRRRVWTLWPWFRFYITQFGHFLHEWFLYRNIYYKLILKLILTFYIKSIFL